MRKGGKIMEKEDRVVRIGSKPKEKYLQAVFYQLDHTEECIIRGLGSRQGKTLELRLDVEDIDGVEADEVKSIKVNGTPGIEVHLKRGGSGDG
ncbi:hypothetical protein AKJ56_01335 [candidate division MSBL1 archaeon SCGC-AAA382N08]|uniref:Uncharacterized protein n=1 Tax=candidate division MSBL1 archaeon SCGC-AAA382N08 TaxID=1698285 RepID=A0A133VPP3_9EURY|nr:hypothetical protein AKJ56_01335 [candidate division MSBL1 archaeon SCGC-AAA382N08]